MVGLPKYWNQQNPPESAAKHVLNNLLSM